MDEGWGWDGGGGGMGVGVGVASGESGPWATIYTFLIIIKTIELNVVKLCVDFAILFLTVCM